jgi:uncharacterized protein YjiK
MKIRSLAVVLLSILLLTACNSRKSGLTADNKEKNLKDTSALSRYNTEDSKAKFLELDDYLKNISGLAFTSDDRLFCDLDDSTDIIQLDTKTGKIVKRFYVGDASKKHSEELKSNYEDIAIVGERFFILNSHGRVLECKEGKDREHVEFTVYKTGLKKDNNVEGLCYDSETNALLLACKDYPGDAYEKKKTIYTFSLVTMTMADTPRFQLPYGKLKTNSADEEFRPSGIARHPVTGTFFIITYHGHSIIEISKDGTILNQRDLPEEIHPQPEGIAFSKDNTMFISDEGKDQHPRLTAYPMIRK